MHNFSQSHHITKSVCRSDKGIVASQHRKASEVGAQILRQGGNAMDAAVAVSFAIGVLEPWMSGIGGGGYMVHRNAKTGEVKVIDFGMRSPQNLNPADYPLEDGISGDLFPWTKVKDDRNSVGATSIAIPGVVAGMALGLKEFGSLNWADVISPSIPLAEKGILVDWYAQLLIMAECRNLAKSAKTRDLFLEPDGLPRAGSWTKTTDTRITFPDLANTLRGLAENGPEWFYKGELAQKIVADINASGGCFSLSDLSDYSAKIVNPLEIAHAGGTVYATPELTAGPTLKNVLNLISQHHLDSDKPDAQSFSAYGTSLIQAYRDRLSDLGDGDAEQKQEGCTTHFNVVDKDGNMVSVTQTLLSVFGSKVTLPQSGILMNNGIMWFDPEQGKTNSLQPNKRCLCNMCPVIAEKGGHTMALGSAGGRKILPAVTQLLSFMLDYDMSLEEAFHQPRIDASGVDGVSGNDRLPASVHDKMTEQFNYSQTHWTPYPHSFAIPCCVSRSGKENQGMTDIMSPWSDAVAQ